MKGYQEMARYVELSASLEDYLEAIFNLSSEQGFARGKEIAEKLEVSKPSVTGALRILSERGLVNYKPYGYVTLTEEGRLKATGVVKKHNVLTSFFTSILGVDAADAQKAACSAEHALGSEVISRLMCFVDFASKESCNGSDLVDRFREYYRQRKQQDVDSPSSPKQGMD